jgi:putative ABC transport system substrate-binding protein
MKRRAFLAGALIVAGCGRSEPQNVPAAQVATEPRSVPSPAQGRVPRVTVLTFGSRNASVLGPGGGPKLIHERLAEIGYVEGKTLIVEEAYADGDPQRLTQLARDIAASRPDVIVTLAAAATLAARQATSTIPIVMAHAGSPVESGLVKTLARPGGNVTGTTSMVPDLGAKQVDLLRQILPRLSRLGVLVNPTNAGAPAFLTNVREGASRLDIQVIVTNVTRGDEFEDAFEILRAARPDALLVMVEPLIGDHRARVLEFVAASRLPSSFDVGAEFVRNGGLISYGPLLTSHYRTVADYVDKILKGANPADLPIVLPTEFTLYVNLKTAKALGLVIPQELLLTATEVIQ